MKAAELFVRCLENEGVEYVFGIPGEENMDLMDALLDTRIRFVTTRHEQGAAFMADVYGRLTGKAGVCLSTLGPGATNLITGVADANMDHAPVVAIAGQAGTHASAQGIPPDSGSGEPVPPGHQVLAVARTGDHSGSGAQGVQAGAIREARRHFIEFPENIAEMEVDRPSAARCRALHPGGAGRQDRRGRVASSPRRATRSFWRATASFGGHAPNRWWIRRAVEHPGCQLHSWPRALFPSPALCRSERDRTEGARLDYVNCGFLDADVVICVGYDMVEYHPDTVEPHARQDHCACGHAHPPRWTSATSSRSGVVGEITRGARAIAVRIGAASARRNALRAAFGRMLAR